MKTQVAVLLSALAFQACAGITINASRVIYSGKDKVASLNINNRSSTPYKVQIWLDAGLNASRVGLPMVATPPLVYLSPQQSAQLRFIYLGSGLPDDRESLFWVNIQETPPTAGGNHTLQICRPHPSEAVLSSTRHRHHPRQRGAKAAVAAERQ